MKLVDNWRKAHHWLSVQAMVLAGALQAAWIAIPDGLKETLPKWVPHALTGVLLAAGIIGRLVDQSPDANPSPTVPPNA